VKQQNEGELAIIYSNLGALFEDMGTYPKALEYHEKSMLIWQSKNDTSWVAIALGHLGYCSEMKGDLESALEYYLRSYKLIGNNGAMRSTILNSVSIGNVYLSLKQPGLARKWCEQANKMSQSPRDLLGIQRSCLCLYKVYDHLKDAESALDYYRKYIEMRDSIFSNDRVKELTRLELNFDFQREQLADSLAFANEQALTDERIRRQRIGLFSSGSMLVLIIILALAIYTGKRRSEHLLLNILPASIAKELKSSGGAKAKRLENVTVLFTDFKGFTSISEQLTPEELVTEIHDCFCAFDRIMEKHGVEKIKTIGDAYMAAGGVPEPRDTHAVDVVSAALDIHSFMNERNAHGKKPGFEIRIGVHTGPVVAGIVGLKKFQYDIWGDTVNTASRMESSGEVGRINISQTTYELVKNRFECSPRGKIAAKGKGEIDMYFVHQPVS